MSRDIIRSTGRNGGASGGKRTGAGSGRKSGGTFSGKRTGGASGRRRGGVSGRSKRQTSQRQESKQQHLVSASHNYEIVPRFKQERTIGDENDYVWNLQAATPGKYSAARSHELNQEYMQDFEAAYAEMAGIQGPRCEACGTVFPNEALRFCCQCGTPVPAEVYSMLLSDSTPPIRADRKRNAGSNYGYAQSGGGVGGVPVESLQNLTISTIRVQSLKPTWYEGPLDPAGKEVDISDRPSLCMSVRGNEAVIGSTDHALYTIDLKSGKRRRKLYSRNAGHSEWVTCVTHIANDGRIVSGGMDSKICVWNKSGVSCRDLNGHTSSVSVLKASDDGRVIVSGSYDRTLRVWDSKSSRSLSTLKGHKGPILDIAWQPGFVVSGSRDGTAIAWDLSTGKAITQLKGHKGHVVTVNWYSDDNQNVFMTGAQDGHVRIWDIRARERVANIAAHVNSRGSGAVIAIESTSLGGAASGGDVIVSGGADRKLCVLEPRTGFEISSRFDQHRDFIYSLHIAGNIAFSGGGDGMLLAHDLTERKVLWGLGACQNGAVRCIGTTSEYLVVGEEQGKTLIWDF